jgi:hypothetical protein
MMNQQTLNQGQAYHYSPVSSRVTNNAYGSGPIYTESNQYNSSNYVVSSGNMGARVSSPAIGRSKGLSPLVSSTSGGILIPSNSYAASPQQLTTSSGVVYGSSSSAYIPSQQQQQQQQQQQYQSSYNQQSSVSSVYGGVSQNGISLIKNAQKPSGGRAPEHINHISQGKIQNYQQQQQLQGTLTASGYAASSTYLTGGSQTGKIYKLMMNKFT